MDELRADCYDVRWNEAIDCMNRALLCSDGSEMIHHVFLASLYEKIGQLGTSAMHHRRCVEIGQKEGRHLGDYAKSAVIAAQYDIELATPVEPIPEGGEVPDLERARMLLEPVAASNVEDAAAAQELLRKLKVLTT